MITHCCWRKRFKNFNKLEKIWRGCEYGVQYGVLAIWSRFFSDDYAIAIITGVSMCTVKLLLYRLNKKIHMHLINTHSVVQISGYLNFV